MPRSETSQRQQFVVRYNVVRHFWHLFNHNTAYFVSILHDFLTIMVMIKWNMCSAAKISLIFRTRDQSWQREKNNRNLTSIKRDCLNHDNRYFCPATINITIYTEKRTDCKVQSMHMCTENVNTNSNTFHMQIYMNRVFFVAQHAFECCNGDSGEGACTPGDR